MSLRTYILPVLAIVHYMTLVNGSTMFVPHSPQPALHTCGWACGPGALTSPHAREGERERETDRQRDREEREREGRRERERTERGEERQRRAWQAIIKDIDAPRTDVLPWNLSQPGRIHNIRPPLHGSILLNCRKLSGTLIERPRTFKVRCKP